MGNRYTTEHFLNGRSGSEQKRGFKSAESMTMVRLRAEVERGRQIARPLKSLAGQRSPSTVRKTQAANEHQMVPSA